MILLSLLCCVLGLSALQPSCAALQQETPIEVVESKHKERVFDRSYTEDYLVPVNYLNTETFVSTLFDYWVSNSEGNEIINGFFNYHVWNFLPDFLDSHNYNTFTTPLSRFGWYPEDVFIYRFNESTGTFEPYYNNTNQNTIKKLRITASVPSSFTHQYVFDYIDLNEDVFLSQTVLISIADSSLNNNGLFMQYSFNYANYNGGGGNRFIYFSIPKSTDYYRVIDSILYPEEVDRYNEGYDKGYEVGNLKGFESGETFGYQNGYQDALNNSDYNSTALTIFTGILEVGLLPVNVFLAMFNYEVFGINIAGIVSSLLTVSIVIIVIRFLFGGKKDD